MLEQQKPREFYAPEQWLNSQLSIARYTGAVNGTLYEVDPVTNDLCRGDVAMARREAARKPKAKPACANCKGQGGFDFGMAREDCFQCGATGEGEGGSNG